MAIRVAHNTSIDRKAEIADDVQIGPFCVIGPHVHIGTGTRLENNVTLMGHVEIGRNNHIYPNVVIGGAPQDVSYKGGATRVLIGDSNILREGVTVNCGSDKEEGITVVGNHNFLMATSHVAHDCYLEDHIIMANGALLGGHVHIQSHASISGGAGVHQFASIGSYSFVNGLSRVLHDVPPFMLVEGTPARPRCINIVALKRKKFSSQVINCLAESHRLIYRAKVGLEHACEILRSNNQLVPEVLQLLNFVQAQQEGRHGRNRECRRAA